MSSSSRRATVLVLVPGRSALRLELPGSLTYALLGLMLLTVGLGTVARLGWDSFHGVDAVVRPRELSASLERLQRSLRSLERGEVAAAHAERGREQIAVHVRAQQAVAAAVAPALRTGAPALRMLGTLPAASDAQGVVNARSVLHAFSARRAAFGGARDSVFDVGGGVLRLTSLRLGESLRVQPFDQAGMPQAEAFAELSRLMRCRVTGEEVAIDPRLVKMLLQLGAIYNRPIQLISGHRTALVNGTTESSQHAIGRAADIRIAGVGIEELRRRLIELGARGVGLYPEKGFVHADVRAKARYHWTWTEADGEQEDMRPDDAGLAAH